MKPEGIPAEITVIRSSRRTLAVEIRPDGSLLVRAPQRLPEREIVRFLEEKAAVIAKHVQRQQARSRQLGSLTPFTPEEMAEITAEAKRRFPERTAHFAALLGVTYGRITIRSQKTRWGSCSASGALSFNCLLVQAPPEVLDSVVVHELCHRIHPNHSAAFYAEIARVFPDYARCHAWLKENGAALLRRLPQYR